MEKIWLKSYEAGVNAEIDPAHYTSMIDVVQQSVAKFGDQTAFYSMGKELSYRQIGELSDHFASYLQNVLKLPRGERVAVMMPNLLQYPIAVFGILKAGLVVVNTNPLYTPRELEHQLNDSGASTIIVLENFANTLEQQYPSETIVLDIRAPDAAAADALQRQKRLDFYLRNGFQIAPYQWVEEAERYAVLYKGNSLNPQSFATLLAKTTFNLVRPTLQAA